MIVALAIGGVFVGGGVQAEVPDDGAPAVLSLLAEGRYALLDGADVGLYAAGGVGRLTGERLRIDGKLELAATLGAQIPLVGPVSGRMAARAGVIRVLGWPRGPLPSLNEWGPAGAVELAAPWHIAGAWRLEPVLGWARVRLGGAFVDLPYGGVRVGAVFAELSRWP